MGTKNIMGLQIIKEPSFFSFIIKNKQNRRLLLIAFAANVVLFFVFKLLCPDGYLYPSDGNSYVVAALESREVFYRPYGYPQFLQIIHSFSSSLDFLLWIQFLLLFISGQFCFFSVDYLYGFRHVVIRKISWALISFNPIFLFLANFVLSDPLFIALSVCYITLLLWIIKKPHWVVFVLQAVLLYWAFQIRYTALYYPLLTLFAFVLSKKVHLGVKALCISLSFLFIYASYNKIKNKVTEITGVNVFSGFSGWQLANNVMGLYPHINTSNDFPDNPDMHLLDTIARIYIDSIPADILKKVTNNELTTAFLWQPKGPLKIYTYAYSNKYKLSYFVAWHQVSEIYDAFGKTIIKNHPTAFLKYYIWPNTKLYFMPEAEVLGNYVDAKAKTPLPAGTIEWFDLKIKETENPMHNPMLIIAKFATWLKFVTAILSPILSVLLLLKLKKGQKEQADIDKRSIIFWILMVVCNMAFSIFAALIVLRYECLWLIIGFGFPLIMLDRLFTIRKTPS